MDEARIQDLLQEKTWVEAAKRGDLEAFNQLVLKYQDHIVSVVFQILRDFEEAQDMAQEAFVKAFRSLESFRGDAKFSTWLYRIAINLAKSKLRWKKLRSWVSFSKYSDEEGEFEIDPVDEAPLSREQAISKEMLEAIDEGLKKLDAEFREVIVLRDMQELSYEEIAKVLSLNVGTVKSRLSRARKSLRELLKEHL